MSDPLVRRPPAPNPFQFHPLDLKPKIVPPPPAPPPVKPKKDPEHRPSHQAVQDTRVRVRQQEDDLRQRFQLQSNAQALDHNFRRYDAAPGDKPDGVISRDDLLRVNDSTARYFLDHPDRFAELEAPDGDDPDGKLSVNDIDRFMLKTREDYGPLPSQRSLEPPTAREMKEMNAAHDRLNDPDVLRREFAQRDLTQFSEPELNALAKLNAEDPKLRKMIGDETRAEVNRASSLDDLPPASGFRLLLADHVDPASMQPLIDNKVSDRLDQLLDHRKGDGSLELAIKRFQADVQDMMIADPLYKNQFASAAQSALDDDDVQHRFEDIAHADDGWLEDAGRWTGGAIRDSFDFLAGSNDPTQPDPLGLNEFGRDLTRGAGEGLAGIVEGGTSFVSHPIQGVEGIWDTITHPGKIVDHYLQSAHDEGAGFAIGELAVDAFGLKGAGRALKSAKEAFQVERRLGPEELAIWDRLSQGRETVAQKIEPYRELPRAIGPADASFLQPVLRGYTPDPHFAQGMSEAIDGAKTELTTARQSGPVSSDDIDRVLGRIGKRRRELAHDAFERDPANEDLRAHWQDYGRPVGDDTPVDYITGDNRHRALAPRAQQYIAEHGGQPNEISIEVGGVRHDVQLSHVIPFRDDGAQIWHPPPKDMKLLRQRGDELIAEVMNSPHMTEAQATRNIAEANFMYMHGTPFLRGTPASVEALDDAVMRARFGKTFPAKAPGVEPFWEAIFARPGAAGVHDFVDNFRSYYQATDRPPLPGVFSPVLGASIPAWNETQSHPDT